MPNDRLRRRAARRGKSASRRRIAPLLLLGLVAAAVLGRAPSNDQPVRWTIRAPEAWMADFDGVRLQRTAALTPAAAPVVVAEADLPPRDVPKQVPLTASEPATTGSIPVTVSGAGAVETKPEPRSMPVINRGGKADRLFAPTPLGRSTDRDLMVKPTLAVVPPSLDAWPPLTTIASLTAPQGERVLPRAAMGSVGGEPLADPRIVVAMVRSGPGRVVTQSAIASLGGDARRIKGRIVLPPVPEAQVAAAGPRSTVWAMPPVPEMGYAKPSAEAVEYRFKSLLGDDDGTAAKAETPDDQLPP